MTSQEKSFFVFTICALSALGIFAYSTEGQIFMGPMINALGLGEDVPKNAHLYCLDKRYYSSSFCEGRRIEEREKWRGVVNSAAKPGTAFSLRGSK